MNTAIQLLEALIEETPADSPKLQGLCIALCTLKDAKAAYKLANNFKRGELVSYNGIAYIVCGDSKNGAAYIFRQNGGQWVDTKELTRR